MSYHYVAHLYLPPVRSPIVSAVDGQGSSEQDDPLPEQSLRQTVDATRCLFCYKNNLNFDANISHMLSRHDFLVPEQDRLLVDIETLIAYLDLVVKEYAQCLYCETLRGTSEAARHHMIAKGHCKIDITNPGCEFRDFYDFQFGDPEEDVAQGGSDAKLAAPLFVNVDETSVRLPSGKILSNRTVRTHTHRERHFSRTTSDTILIDNSSPTTEAPEMTSNHEIGLLRRGERRNIALGNQLCQLRTADRASLIHMTPAEQRSQLLVQKKQTDQARRAQRQMESRVQRVGNKTLMKHFVPDVPGPTNG